MDEPAEDDFTEQSSINSKSCFNTLSDESLAMINYNLPIEFMSSKRKKQFKSKRKKFMSFKQRKYELFTKFDYGIKLDKESFLYVTPELIAKEIAQQCSKLFKYELMLDGFAGCGGNIIQFALQNPNSIIFAIDNNKTRLNYAKHNARIYNVDHQIEFILGDYMCLAKTFRFKADCVFLSPPWGGYKYDRHSKFTFDLMPINGKEIYLLTKQFVSNNIAYYLPRNFDLYEYKQFNEKIKVVENLIYGHLSSYVIYSGQFSLDYDNITIEKRDFSF